MGTLIKLEFCLQKCMHLSPLLLICSKTVYTKVPAVCTGFWELKSSYLGKEGANTTVVMVVGFNWSYGNGTVSGIPK